MIHFNALTWATRALFTIAIFIGQADAFAQFSATGSSAGTVTTTSVAQGFDWVNPTNISTANAVYATSLITGSNKSTYFLDAKNWGFQSTTSGQPNYIPPTATINGIEVYILRRRTNVGTVKGQRIILLKAAAEAGTNKSTGSTWPTVAATSKFGSSVDLWGTTWTPTDLTNAGFGVRIQARNQGNKAAQAEVDHVQIIVFFNQTFYYSKSTGNLELTSSWGTNTDGTGTAPGNFTNNGQVFVLRNRAAASLTANLAISGTNSKMVVGDGTSATALTIPSNFTYTGQVDVASASSVINNNVAALSLNSLAINTTVTYGAAGDQPVAENTYYNLTITGTGTKNLQTGTTGVTNVTNVLTIGSGATLNNQGNTVFVTGISNGINNSGTATGTGRYVYSLLDVSTSITGTGSSTYSNLDVEFTTTAATRTLTLGNAATFTGNLNLVDGTFANGANLTMATGSTITVADGTLGSTIAGSTGYDVIYNSYTTASPKTTGNELSGTLRHFTLQTGTGLTVNLNRNLVLTGNLTLTSGTLDPTTTPYNLAIGGNYVNNATLTIRNNTTTFNGSTAQTIGGTAGAQTFYNLVINNGAGGSVALNVPVTANNALTLTNGIVTTTGANTLTLLTNNITGGSTTSFINGPLVHSLSATSGTRNFPIGKGTSYKSVSLTINQASAAATQYTAEIFNADPPVRTLPPTLSKVSEIRYYTLASSNVANLTNATITINYGPDDGVTDAPNLRIAKSNGGAWENIDGTGTANITGSITSSPFTASFGDFVLANATGGNNVLPLTWVSFSAKKKNNSVQLEWKTAQEVNTSRFDIERSGNGADWNLLETINSNNAAVNKYSYTDDNPHKRLNLYRIKNIDRDGKYSYSRVAVVSFDETRKGITISPNPVIGGMLNCVLHDEYFLQQNKMMVRIIDIHGKIVNNYYDRPAPVMKINTGSLLPGNYLLTIQAGGRYIKQPFVVVR
jgi:hypothetical protein